MDLCPICIENPAENYTECGHSYCIGCLSRIKSCSICRKSLLRTQLCQDIRSKYNINFITRGRTIMYVMNSSGVAEIVELDEPPFTLTPEHHMPSAIYDNGNSINHSVLRDIMGYNTTTPEEFIPSGTANVSFPNPERQDLHNAIYRIGRYAPVTRH